MSYNDNNNPNTRSTNPGSTSAGSSSSHVRETRVDRSSGTGMALLIGGIVVAIGFILWLVIGSGPTDTITTQPAGDTTNINVEPPADTGTATGTAPAADAPATTAPATDVPATDAPAADAPAADAPAADTAPPAPVEE
jgi:hypothetical protein